MDRLGKTLKRELARSPKKTAILSLMCLVALYFWVPLLSSWLSQQEPTAAATAVAGQQANPQAVSEGTSGKAPAGTPGSSARPWETVLQWIGQDPLMAAAGVPDDLRNPFAGNSQWQTAVTASTNAIEPEDKLELTPQQLGLRLNSTVVGPRSRAASINGRTYRERSQIVLHPAGTGVESGKSVAFTLIRIQPEYVVLLRDGQEYSLAMSRSKLAEGDVIQREPPR